MAILNAAYSAAGFAYRNRRSISRAYSFGRAAIRGISRGRSVLRRNRSNSNAMSISRGPPPAHRRPLRTKQYAAVKGNVGTPHNRVYKTTGRTKPPFTKGSKRVANQLLKYQKLGVVHVDEVQGTINDADCVYLAHMSYCQLDMIKYAVEALVRKLFHDIAKFKCDSLMQEIPGQSITDASSTWVVKLITQKLSDGTTGVQLSHDVPDNGTIQSVAAIFYPEFVTWSSGYTSGATTGSNENTLELAKFQLYRQDFNVTSQAKFCGELDLRDLQFHYYAKSELKCQNRSLSATGATGGADATDISNNPLIGYLYNFKGVPKSANANMADLEKFNNTAAQKGVMLIRGGALAGSSLTGGNNFKEPPLPRTWKNCTTASKVSLDPGDIRKGVCSVTKSENFLQFLKTTHFQQGTAELSVTWGKMPTQMIALEDMLNVNTVATISVAYECNRVSGCYLTTIKRAHVIQQQFAQASTYNNQP